MCVCVCNVHTCVCACKCVDVRVCVNSCIGIILPECTISWLCEHYIVPGLCSNIPNWTISAQYALRVVKNGYDYRCFVTGVSQHVKLKKAKQPESDHVVPDLLKEKTMVAMTAEVCTNACFVFFPMSVYIPILILFLRVSSFCSQFSFCVASIRHYTSPLS